MTINDVYVNTYDARNAKSLFQQIENFDLLFKKMMQYIYKYLPIIINPESYPFFSWMECCIEVRSYPQRSLNDFIKNSINQRFIYKSSYLIPFDGVQDWSMIIYKPNSCEPPIMYFVNANMGKTIEINFTFNFSCSGLNNRFFIKLKDMF